MLHPNVSQVLVTISYFYGVYNWENKPISLESFLAKKKLKNKTYQLQQLRQQAHSSASLDGGAHPCWEPHNGIPQPPGIARARVVTLEKHLEVPDGP